MSRVKTFDATGVAPNGRLYSGDLNLIQDQYADLSNFSQTHGVGTLQVGDSSLQILKHGTGEIRLSADVRTDGVLRGLGGLVAGAFTTAARDALPQADRPFGVVILNTTKNRLEWNTNTDVSPVWRGVIFGAESIDIPAGMISGYSNLATRPAATTVATGSFWYVTDMDTVFRSNGTTWDRVAPGKPGKVDFYPRSAAPAGHVACDGTALLAATAIYADLRAELIAEGNPFGVSGSDPLLPNVGNRVPVGMGADAEFNVMGETGGAKTHSLSAAETGLRNHTHGMSHDHALQMQDTVSGPSHAGFPASVSSGGTVQDHGGGGSGSPIKNFVGSTNGITESAGSAHNNLQPYIALRAVIHL